MTGGFTVQGWCPGALRPMQLGDGLVVRLRAPGGRLSPAQAAGLAVAAGRHGNGRIDLSARGNLQLRGVSAASHPALIKDLRALALVDADPAAEARRNLLITPFADAATDALAAALEAALTAGAGLPDLPGKFGFVVDTGPAPVLQASPGDIRLERSAAGGLILRADGAAQGAPVTAPGAVAAALALARWFVAAGGMRGGRGRMAALIGQGAQPDGALRGRIAPAAALPPPEPGPPEPGPPELGPSGPNLPGGLLVAAEFGQIGADALAALAALGPLRLTPWRMLLVEGASDPAPLRGLPGLILSPGDPRLRVAACTGAPGCLQAQAPVRDLARRLAPHVPAGRVLHVSACAKGCAHPGAAAVTLVAGPAGFGLVRGGTAQDVPARWLPAPDPQDLKGLF